jgi:hypothetical protein
MDQLSHIASVIALTMGLGWASGINLYAAIFMLGIVGATGNMVLPQDLQILQNPIVIVAAGFMYLVEFVADKIPGVDTGWDTLHTFIRIPAGALLAMGAVGEVNSAVSLAAAILGGGMAAASHVTKAGTRVMVNASPEPVTNWVASLTEDAVVVGGLWTAVNHPWIFIIFLIVFILLLIWLLPKLWRGIKKILGFIGRIFGFKKKTEITEDMESQKIDGDGKPVNRKVAVEGRIEKLNELLEKKLITNDEYRKKKDEILKEI